MLKSREWGNRRGAVLSPLKGDEQPQRSEFTSSPSTTPAVAQLQCTCRNSAQCR